MVRTLLKPLDMFKDIINIANIDKKSFKEETKTLISSELNDVNELNGLKQDEKEYNHEFTIFMSILGVTAILAIGLLSFGIIKNNKMRFSMGQFVDFEINKPKHIFLEWFAEIFVTLCLLVFIYVYFAHITSDYIYANIMDLFV